MRLFGKKSNQLSTKPDVPPELRPYYSTQSSATAGMGQRIAAVTLIVLLLAVGVIGGVWLWNHANSNTKSKSNVAIGSNQNTPGTPSKNNGSSNTATPAPVPVPQNSAPAPSPSPQPTPSPAPAQSTAPTNAIPNTGPGTTALFAALAIGILSAAVSYIRRIVTQ